MKQFKWMIGLTLMILVPHLSVFGQDDPGLLDDFESIDAQDRWWSYTDGSDFACVRESPGYESDYSLHLTFVTDAQQYPGCGMHITDPAAWIASSGISFVWRSDAPDLTVRATVSLADPTQTNPDAQGLTPFEVALQTPGDTWTPVTIPWGAFTKAEWVGDTGITLFDLQQAAELIFSISEAQQGSIWIDDLRLNLDVPQPAAFDKFSLWTDGTQLRGANVWQRLVVPQVDGLEFLGNGHVGPPYIQSDFDRLAALGANYVNLSLPGLFTEDPPYVLDEVLQTNLDAMLDMAAQANLFVVISARTGPGRSDFTFYDQNIEAWGGDRSLVKDTVWTDQAAQDAWVAMWRYTAERYRDNPVVVGYDLLVEPNGAGRLLEIYDPEVFYPAYSGTLYDWNQFYPRIVQAIREVDSDTPILVAAQGWSSVRWLPYLRPVDDPRVVYTVHQYEPQEQYTHQDPPAENGYPGHMDVNWDGVPDTFDRAWLEQYLSIIDAFKARYGVPVAVNEYGLKRWVPGAADFMRDEMAAFEQRGLNNAFWAFNPAWGPHQGNDAFDYWHGPDPNNHSNVASSDLITVILDYWSRNTIRP